MNCVEPITSIKWVASRQIPGNTPTTEHEFWVTWREDAGPSAVEKAAVASMIDAVLHPRP